MLDDRRDQIYTFVEKELIGPDPLDKDGFVQENGEEILISDSPLSRYIAGILFPRDVIEESMSVSETEEQETADYEEGEDEELNKLQCLQAICHEHFCSTGPE